MQPHTTTRPWIGRVVAVLVCMLVLYAGVLWFYQGSAIPEADGQIGVGAELQEGTYAAVVLFSDKYRDLAFAATGVPHTTLAVQKDGSIVSGEGRIITGTRPSWWFLPSTIGVAYVQSGSTTVARRVSLLNGQIHVQAPRVQALELGIHPDALLAVRCQGSCPILEDHWLQDVEVQQVHGEALLKAAHLSSVEPYLEVSAKRRNAEAVERTTQDGRVIQELVPLETLERESVTETITRMGGEQFSWWIYLGDDVLVSSSQELLQEAISQLSTPTWTNKRCDSTLSGYYNPNSQLELANSQAASPVLVRTTRSWMLCTE